MTHELPPTRENLHGIFGPDLPPVLRILSGDRIVGATLDAGWHLAEQKDLAATPVKSDDPGTGHALNGPVFIEGAEPGDAVEIRFDVLTPGAWGWTVGGGWPSEFNERLGVVEDRYAMNWRIEGERATDREGRTILLAPFLGWVGLMPSGDGPFLYHAATPHGRQPRLQGTRQVGHEPLPSCRESRVVCSPSATATASRATARSRASPWSAR